MRNLGKVLEYNIKQSIPSDMYYMRIKDSPASFGQKNDTTRFTLDNPFDSLLFYNSNLFFIEMKSTQSTSISIQFDKTEKGKMIKLHQIEALTDARMYEIASGFILDFRGSETYWIDILDFNQFLNETTKKSINEDDVEKYNGIKINKQLKKVNYNYDIRKMVDDIIDRKKGDG